MIESETTDLVQVNTVGQETTNTDDITVGEKSLESQQSDAVVLSTPLILEQDPGQPRFKQRAMSVAQNGQVLGKQANSDLFAPIKTHFS